MVARNLGVVLSTLALLVAAVDRSNFKTCDQSSFCKRHRALQVGPSLNWLITHIHTHKKK